MPRRTSRARAPLFPCSPTPAQGRGAGQLPQSELQWPYSALGSVETRRNMAPTLRDNQSLREERS